MIPFLRKDNLCEIIREIGEDALCDICALHPRFFFEINDIEFAGLGASCEAVCELLLDTKEPLKFETEQRQKYTFSELMKLLFPDNRQNSDYHFHITDKQWDTLLDNFRDTEPIDDEWPKEIDRLKKIHIHHVLENQDILQKIFEYIFFRQIERIPEYGIEVVLQFAKECTDFVAIHAQLTGDNKKSLRRFSEQIEYSDVNVDILDNGIRSRYQA